MTHKPMQLETLREVTARERGHDSLQNLPGRFWRDAEEYLRLLDEDLSDDDLEQEEYHRLREERESAAELLTGLAKRRKSKILQLAGYAASDMPASTDPMTASEVELFEDVQETLAETRLEPDIVDEPVATPGGVQ